MSSAQSSPCYPMENPVIESLLRHSHHRSGEKRGGGGKFSAGGLLKMFKLFPMLTSGCKMVALLGRPRKPMIKDNATSGTIFGYRKGRVSLAIQEDPHCMPFFLIELPMHTSALNKEMASDILRIALESETKTPKKKLLEEFVWAVYCNGRKVGYSIRRKQMSEDEMHVMQHLRGVSMGAGVIPSPSEKESPDGELTYMRARFQRVVGSKDSESLYMINPDGGAQGPEFCIFFVRAH
ncbi:protein MIZU-KUSSEI 1-like [Neltuma alba]|uniref:protein MIZU-KUSSEI 1-like n=1 Tax=Neltuma alba TaxID=207710 RepID=UPI0010A4BF8F|nr:protein MIZU-KUSSEI 1-like [Prosopis alba]XP_028802961.1 protein MIZU-KUSSEI 1-like [Prosopis alba]